MDREPQFTGEGGPPLAQQPSPLDRVVWRTATSLETLLRWTAHWTLTKAAASASQPTSRCATGNIEPRPILPYTALVNRVGLGYDVHQLKTGRPLILGGVEIRTTPDSTAIPMPTC